MRCRSLLLLPCLAASACTWWHSQEPVLITSDPLGAHIAVDGRPQSGSLDFVRLKDHIAVSEDHRPAELS